MSFLQKFFDAIFGQLRSSFVNIPLQNPLSYVYVVLSALLFGLGSAGFFTN
mgnify:CR=1 FL=1